jgi:hypothetical protein
MFVFIYCTAILDLSILKRITMDQVLEQKLIQATQAVEAQVGYFQ